MRYMHLFLRFVFVRLVRLIDGLACMGFYFCAFTGVGYFVFLLFSVNSFYYCAEPTYNFV